MFAVKCKLVRGGEAAKQGYSVRKLGVQQAGVVGRRWERKRSRAEGSFV